MSKKNKKNFIEVTKCYPDLINYFYKRFKAPWPGIKKKQNFIKKIKIYQFEDKITIVMFSYNNIKASVTKDRDDSNIELGLLWCYIKLKEKDEKINKRNTPTFTPTFTNVTVRGDLRNIYWHCNHHDVK